MMKIRNSDDVKFIAFYLPQFHNIPENNEWWGDGFTEWVNVKKAKPLYKEHIQPRLPADDRFYNLLDDSVKVWQADLARKNGIDAFCYYHYWFNGKMLLEKPMEQMANNKKIDIPFCISWANEAWTKAWVDEESKVLITQKYGGEKEWIEHYNYLKTFFNDERYIKVDNKPLFIIYRPDVIPCLYEMLNCWNDLAKKDGFDGILLFAQAYIDMNKRKEMRLKGVNGFINYQPSYSIVSITNNSGSNFDASIRKIYHYMNENAEKILGFEIRKKIKKFYSNRIKKYNYDLLYSDIINKKYDHDYDIIGAFPSWDNTPRHKNNGIVVENGSPSKFLKYLKELIGIARHQKYPFVFINAWNEWAEGAVLEPDNIYGDGYLEAVKRSKSET